MSDLTDADVLLIRAHRAKSSALDALTVLTADERLEVLGAFCSSCGTRQPEPPARPCQCWNDE